jgi:Zn-finger nucleic acid-binding protein
MAVRPLIGIAINECAQCNGVWVPGNKIETLVKRATEARSRALESDLEQVAPRKKGANPNRQRVQYRKCPVCEAFMARRNFRKASGIILDRCQEHGTWLDADELEAIARFVIEGGMGSDAARRYTLKTEIDAMKRREAAALARAVKGESIVIREERSFSSEEGGLFGLLMDILK